jgi:hypothetical protein
MFRPTIGAAREASRLGGSPVASKFRPGATVYDKNGRAYVVETVEDGVVYCSAPNGTEAEFPETSLQTEAEWGARADGKRGLVYERLRQARIYNTPTVRVDKSGSERVVAKLERLSPGLLDFAAFTTATQILSEIGESGLVAGLSIAKCREVFDQAKPEAQATVIAGLLGAHPHALVEAGGLGDNLLRAMIAKGLAEHEESFEQFRDRRRR